MKKVDNTRKKHKKKTAQRPPKKIAVVGSVLGRFVQIQENVVLIGTIRKGNAIAFGDHLGPLLQFLCKLLVHLFQARNHQLVNLLVGKFKFYWIIATNPPKIGRVVR